MHRFLNLDAINSRFQPALDQAALRVVHSGRYIGGPEVEAFERELAAATGVDHAVGVSNGLDAIRLIFRAWMDLGRLHPGDEVITSSNNYIAGILAATDCGLRPIFVEPDPATFNLDPTRIEAAITPRTRAIMPVHLYGRVSVLPDSLRERFLIVEDCAQAIGASLGGRRVGSLGHAGAFSFYPSKNIGALGDAGAVTTNDAALAQQIRALRNYGSLQTYVNRTRGLNCRLDPLQAAMLRVKLPFTDRENSLRRANAMAYDRLISNPNVIKPSIPDDPAEHVWHQYVVRIRAGRRDHFRDFLANHDVETAVHYPKPAHLQPCYAADYGHLRLPIAFTLCNQVVSLPIGPDTSETDVAQIAEIINRFSR